MHLQETGQVTYVLEMEMEHNPLVLVALLVSGCVWARYANLTTNPIPDFEQWALIPSAPFRIGVMLPPCVMQGEVSVQDAVENICNRGISSLPSGAGLCACFL